MTRSSGNMKELTSFGKQKNRKPGDGSCDCVNSPFWALGMRKNVKLCSIKS